MNEPSTVADAQALAIALCEAGSIERVPLADALDRILREPLVAAADVPQAPTSMMDGYAVRAVDLHDRSDVGERTLRVVEESAAGHPSRRALKPGEAAPIATGAIVPPGADTIAPIEWCAPDGQHVVVRGTGVPGRFVRAPGSDLAAGELLARAGERVDAALTALFAAEGHTTVAVSPRPSIAILSTGAELRAPGTPLPPGELYDANGPALAALVRKAGGIAKAAVVVGDELAATKAAIDAARGASMILVSGGVSVGEHDHVRPAILALGGEILLWRIAMKPGKPLVLARLGATPIVGLPGNPVSAQVGFMLFVRPMIRKLLGAAPVVDSPLVEVSLLAPLSLSTDRPTYLRARVHAREGKLVAAIIDRQRSAAIISLAQANALVRIEPGEHELPAGAIVRAILVDALHA